MIGALLLALAAGDLEDGIALLDAGKPAAALVPLRRAAAAAPADPRPLLHEGRCLRDLNRFDEAIAVLERARSLEPASPAAANALARALLDADRLDEAGTLLDGAIAAHPDDPDLLFAFGLAAFRRGRPTAEPLRRMVGRAPFHPDAPAAHGLLARIHAREGDGARAASERSLAEATGRWHQAKKTREAQVRENPGDPLGWLGLGLVWMEARDWDRAEDAFSKSAEADPKFARARFHLGEVRRRRNDFAGAAARYAEALAIDPKYTRAHYHLGLAAANLGRGAEAKRAFEAVLSLDPEFREDPIYKECWKHLGRLAEGAGDRPAAKRCYGEYLKRGGADPEVAERLKRL